MRYVLTIVTGLLAGAAEAQDAAMGEELFQHFCAACHGVGAQGDGPMANVLLVPPADLTQLSARNGGSFPHARVGARIDGRDPLVSHGSEMPVYGWLFTDEPVAMKLPSGQPMLADKPVAALMAYLETLQE